MKYIIDGKPACQIARKKGITNLYQRIRKMPLEMAVKKTLPLQRRYIIKKDGQYVYTCRSIQQAANYLETTKGTICGLFFRHGNKINLFGYTIERRVRREDKKDSNL